MILFRLGKANDAKAIGQFTIDLVAKRVWDEVLPGYLKAAPLRDDSLSWGILLDEAIDFIKDYDPGSSRCLEKLVTMMDLSF